MSLTDFIITYAKGDYDVADQDREPAEYPGSKHVDLYMAWLLSRGCLLSRARRLAPSSGQDVSRLGSNQFQLPLSVDDVADEI